MNFKEVFVNYQNVLAFYCFFKMHKKNLVENNQQRIELMFDLDKIFLNRSLTIGQKHARFLTLIAFHKKLLDELSEIFIRVQ